MDTPPTHSNIYLAQYRKKLFLVLPKSLKMVVTISLHYLTFATEVKGWYVCMYVHIC